MATPSYEELLQGTTQWSFTEGPVSFQLSHHSHRKANPSSSFSFISEGHPGIWCYYLLIPEQMFPHRWPDFACVLNDDGFHHPGPAFNHDLFDSEITYSESKPYWDRGTSRQWDLSKVGCDYAHLWHDEQGYPDTFASVKSDAQHTARKFIKENPDYYCRCQYSGQWGEPSEFYTAQNGRTVHKSYAGTFKGGWVAWEPETKGIV